MKDILESRVGLNEYGLSWSRDFNNKEKHDATLGLVVLFAQSECNEMKDVHEQQNRLESFGKSFKFYPDSCMRLDGNIYVFACENFLVLQMKYITGMIILSLTGCGQNTSVVKRSLAHDLLNQVKLTPNDMEKYSKIYATTTVEECSAKLGKDLKQIIETCDGLNSDGQAHCEAMNHYLETYHMEFVQIWWCYINLPIQSQDKSRG
jgi:hypothetical protein